MVRMRIRKCSYGWESRSIFATFSTSIYFQFFIHYHSFLWCCFRICLFLILNSRYSRRHCSAALFPPFLCERILFPKISSRFVGTTPRPTTFAKKTIGCNSEIVECNSEIFHVILKYSKCNSEIFTLYSRNSS
jgi:hypothetical protein